MMLMFYFSLDPDEPRVVGAGRDERSRRRSGRERSGPAPISRSRTGQIRPSKEQGCAERSAAESGATLFPVPAEARLSRCGCLS